MIDGLHHVSRSVADMDRSLEFYAGKLGLQVVIDADMSGEMLEREVALEGATLRLVQLATGPGEPALELLEYRSPAPEVVEPRPCDVGAHHVAFHVPDMDSAYRELSAAGVEFTCPPQQVDVGFFSGHWTAYCYDPDRMIVELWQTPQGTGR